MTHSIQLDESQRQAALLALAHLSLERPGWDHLLREIAAKLDNPDLAMYEGFKVTGASEESPTPTPPCLRCEKPDRMPWLGRIETDFGGAVSVWVCKRCGVAALLIEGERL